MKKTIALCVVTFLAGIALAVFYLSPFTLAGEFEGKNGARIKERIVYEADGSIREAQFSCPTWFEYYEVVAREAGVTISTGSSLDRQGVTISIKSMRWEDAIPLFYPMGFEVVKVGDKSYKVQKKPIKSSTAQRP